MIDVENVDNLAWWNDEVALRREQAVYDAVRKKIQGLHKEVGKRVARAEMMDVGRKMGIVRRNTLCFDSEEHSAIFMDYLYHFSRVNGSTAYERYLKSLNRQNEDEVTRLAHDAFAGLRYSVISGTVAKSGFGLLCNDHFLGRQIFLLDRGLSQQLDGKVALATALYPVNNWFMTTGAALPLPETQLNETLSDLFLASGLMYSPPIKLAPKEASRLALTAIRAIGNAGIIERVRYQ